MSSAKVLSLESLQQFYLDLQKFRTNLLREVENLELELRRLTNWVDVEASSYWQSENQLVRRRMSEFLQQLSRCMSYVREEERKPCTEEKKRVARAKERAELCDNKLRITKAASTQWEARANKVKTKLQRCRDMAESELLVALTRLQTHIERLESYSQLRTALPQSSLPASSSSKEDATLSNDGQSEQPPTESSSSS